MYNLWIDFERNHNKLMQVHEMGRHTYKSLETSYIIFKW
jgi:hypothetical protein